MNILFVFFLNLKRSKRNKQWHKKVTIIVIFTVNNLAQNIVTTTKAVSFLKKGWRKRGVSFEVLCVTIRNNTVFNSISLYLCVCLQHEVIRKLNVNFFVLICVLFPLPASLFVVICQGVNFHLGISHWEILHTLSLKTIITFSGVQPIPHIVYLIIDTQYSTCVCGCTGEGKCGERRGWKIDQKISRLWEVTSQLEVRMIPLQ